MPSNFTEEDSVYPLFGADFGETEEEAILRKRDELFQKLRAEADAEAGAEEAAGAVDEAGSDTHVVARARYRAFDQGVGSEAGRDLP